MIFTNLGLLVVAAGLLLAGIAKSSVTLLMASLFLTVVAGVVLAMVLPAARRLTAVSPAPAFAGVAAGNGMGQPVVLYVQQAPITGQVTQTLDLTAPVVGYDAMSAQQIVKLVESGALGEEQLAALREYESAHAARRTVLARLDRATA